jgi:hypothetical protein
MHTFYNETISHSCYLALYVPNQLYVDPRFNLLDNIELYRQSIEGI